MAPFRAILLPGSVLPAELAYGSLVAALGSDADAVAKELEVYATAEAPADYTLDPDCGGTVHFTDHDHRVFFNNPHDLAMVVVDGGHRVRFVLTGTRAAPGFSGGPEVVVSGGLERVDAAPGH